MLTIVLIVVAGGFPPLLIAILLLCQAIRAGQAQVDAGSRISTSRAALAFAVAWLAGPIAVLVVLATGGSVGAILASIVAWRSLLVVFCEGLQHELDTIWRQRRVAAAD